LKYCLLYGDHYLNKINALTILHGRLFKWYPTNSSQSEIWLCWRYSCSGFRRCRKYRAGPHQRNWYWI